MDKVVKSLKFLLIVALVVFYPMLISIYVTLPLFVGFSGLVLVLGLEKERYDYIVYALLYMFSLELNLSLPLILMPISTLIFYFFIKHKLAYIKLCKKCVYVATVLLINFIYFVLLGGYDFITDQSSVNYDHLLIFSFIYDIIAAVVVI